MPSGFQQDTNQLSPNHYRVIITMSNAAIYPTDASLNTSGAVEPFDFNAFTTLPSSLNNSRRRARGNIRWNNIIGKLSLHADCQVLDVTPTNGGNAYTDANTVSDALSFTVKYERDAFVLAALDGTNDSGGNAINTVAKAVRELVVKGIVQEIVRTYRTMDATGGNTQFQESVTVSSPSSAATVYPTVSVSLIDTATLVNA